jgi:glycerate 2-kinase
MQQTSTKTVSGIFQAALYAASPYEAVKRQSSYIKSAYKAGPFHKLKVIGFGKAACPMAKAVEDILPELFENGFVITKYMHCNEYRPSKIRFCEAGHPLPDENGLEGSGEIADILRKSGEETLVVCLISGGGSALLVSPYAGITLDEKKKITDLLLKAGADIHELNSVRKHISKVKGGRLAEIAYPAGVISLILSDVIGDRLDVIASGPTAPDKTTYHDAWLVLKKYGLLEKAPKNVFDVLYKGVNGLFPETPKEADTVFKKVENIIIGSNTKALDAAKLQAEELGFQAEIISSEISGEAKDAAKWLAEKAKAMKNSRSNGFKRPLCCISGGETTVTVKGDGLGGRNMELALAFALEIEGVKGITFLSAGTDGTDGPTDAAGAIVDGETTVKARAAGIEPEEYLKNNNSYNFFKKIDALFITGPTGTNVMDIQIVVMD